MNRKTVTKREGCLTKSNIRKDCFLTNFIFLSVITQIMTNDNTVLEYIQAMQYYVSWSHATR